MASFFGSDKKVPATPGDASSHAKRDASSPASAHHSASDAPHPPPPLGRKSLALRLEEAVLRLTAQQALEHVSLGSRESYTSKAAPPPAPPAAQATPGVPASSPPSAPPAAAAPPPRPVLAPSTYTQFGDKKRQQLAGRMMADAGGSAEQPSTSAAAAAASAQAGGLPPPPPPQYPCKPVAPHRLQKFSKLLDEDVVDLDALRELSWSGVPCHLRPFVWKLLLGYVSPNRGRREAALSRKRMEYQGLVDMYYDVGAAERSEEELKALRQVMVDVPRTAANVAFILEPLVQKSLERMLFIWGLRHPASGYVQGMNDLAAPFLAVFLSEYLPGPMASWTVDQLPPDALLAVEADCYWCLSKLLDEIQDNYTYAQPGIQRAVHRLRELIRRIEEPVAAHLEAENVDFLQFAFRWVNCLLMREVPFHLAIRLWDTYISEGSRMSVYLVYVCAAFLLQWQEQLTGMEFQDLVLFLQKLPTGAWDEGLLEEVLSKAFMWRVMFDDAQSHLKST